MLYEIMSIYNFTEGEVDQASSKVMPNCILCKQEQNGTGGRDKDRGEAA
jgi:hypothetical protein